MFVSIWGFMGAGKSSIGQEFAARYNWKHIDSDEEIERQEGHSIKTIFANSGEPYFRSLETKLLGRISQEVNVHSSVNPNILLTTGGGMPISTENRVLLMKLGESVFIHVPIEQIIERLKLDKDRPLWDHEQLQVMKEKYAMRLPDYQQADHVIYAHNKTIEEIVIELSSMIS